MPTTPVYCPIIKGKLNDIKAFTYVAAHLRSQMKPLFELPPFVATEKPEQITGRFASRVAKLAPTQNCYVDLPLLSPGQLTSEGDIALEVAYGQLNAVGVQYEPVYGFDRDASLWPLVAAQAKRSGGLLLRLDEDDVGSPDETVEAIVDLARFGLDTSEIAVMLDHRHLRSKEEALLAASSSADFFDILASRTRVRTTYLAGSCAPRTVAEIEKDGRTDFFRNELALWASVATERLSVTPVYSDYGVIHPDFSDLTFSPHINGKVRYTNKAHLHVFRGHSLRQGERFEQYRTLAAKVISSGKYLGSSYSHGDRYIYECATGSGGTGSPGTWVLVDQNHHFTFALQQVTRLLAVAKDGANFDRVLEAA